MLARWPPNQSPRLPAGLHPCRRLYRPQAVVLARPPRQQRTRRGSPVEALVEAEEQGPLAAWRAQLRVRRSLRALAKCEIWIVR